MDCYWSVEPMSYEVVVIGIDKDTLQEREEVYATCDTEEETASLVGLLRQSNQPFFIEVRKSKNEETPPDLRKA